MPKNAKRSVYREKEFEMYVLWKSLPAYFRGMKKAELHSHGFTDPIVMEIAAIKSQTAFAKKFCIKDLGTLTDWNAKISKNKLNANDAHSPFQKQTIAVGDALSATPDIALKIELHELRKLVSELRKENKILMERLGVSAAKKPIKITSGETRTGMQSTASLDPKIVESVGFFKKALAILKGKK